MAISLHTAGSWVAANATTQTVTLPTHSTGDMLIVRVGFKHATMPTTVTCGTSGWAKLGEDNSGTGSSSNGGGDVQVAVFWKVATSASETNPVITFNGGVTAATPSAAVANSYSKGAGETWLDPVGDGAAISVAQNFSATIGTHISTTAGDLVDAFVVTNDNTTLTVPTFTQTGVTFAAVVESPAAALSSGTSNDISADGCYRIANSGTSSAAAVYTGTNSAADIGEAWTTRLRVFTPEAHSGTLTGTGAGSYTNAGQKGAQVAPTITGAGIETSANAKGGQGTVTGTGAGTETHASSGQHNATATGTGAGVLTWDYEFESGEQHSGTFTGTGAGSLTAASTGAHDATVTGTGAGSATLASQAGFQTTLAGSGAGSAAVAQSSARSGAITGTGAGSLTEASTADHRLALTGTGAGSLAAAQAGAHVSTLTGTGAGSAAIAGTQSLAKDGTFTGTGGGTFAISYIAEIGTAPPVPPPSYRPVLVPFRTGTFRATGGGSFTVAARAEWNDDDLVLELAGVA